MSNLKKLNTSEEYNIFKLSSEFILPNVSFISKEGIIKYNKYKESFWKSCAPKVEYDNITTGGDIKISTKNVNGVEKQQEIVSNLMYCVLDQNILDAIKDPDYTAPVKNPENENEYIYLKPTNVENTTQQYILNNENYKIENKVYYLVPAIADVWTTFRIPFDVKKIYIMETCSESVLDSITLTEEDIANNIKLQDKILKVQAKNNADFLNFINLSIRLYPNKTFDEIYDEYVDWAQSKNLEVGKFELIPHSGNNWNTATMYLNRCTGYKEYSNGKHVLNSEQLSLSEEALLKKDEIYTMLLPYCTGCYDEQERKDVWDYWTGKFLIFESTDGPHTINGSKSVGTITTKSSDENSNIIYTTTFNNKEFINEDNMIVSGNNTFAEMKTDQENIYVYKQIINNEGFYQIDSNIQDEYGNSILTSVKPTVAFLYGEISK